jgi:hypothetical protein
LLLLCCCIYILCCRKKEGRKGCCCGEKVKVDVKTKAELNGQPQKKTEASAVGIEDRGFVMFVHARLWQEDQAISDSKWFA